MAGVIWFLIYSCFLHSPGICNMGPILGHTLTQEIFPITHLICYHLFLEKWDLMHSHLNSLVLEMFYIPASGCEILFFHQAENDSWLQHSKWGVSSKYDWCSHEVCCSLKKEWQNITQAVRQMHVYVCITKSLHKNIKISLSKLCKANIRS